MLKSDDVFNRSNIKSYTIMNFYELGYFNEDYMTRLKYLRNFLVNNKLYPDITIKNRPKFP